MRNYRIQHALAAVVMALGLMALCLAVAQPVHGAGNFIIKQYDVQVVVNEDDSYDVTETLDVHFTAESHGIYKTIPYKITLDRDGQRSEFYTKVKDFQMLSGQQVKKIKGDEAYMFKIGDPDQYAATDTQYKLRYTYDMRGDHLDGADEVYYNIVGNKWEAQSIDQVTFRVAFPKAIDMKNVGIKTGNQETVSFEAEGDTVVKGTTDADVMGGLTIRAVLPDGYFTKQATENLTLFYILFGLMGLVTVVGLVLWRKVGVDPDVIETEEFYPPKGMSAPEIAYLDTEAITGEQVTSLLLTLADKGYLRIVDEETKKKRKASYRIEMVKEYDGDSRLERAFLQGLMLRGKTAEDGTLYVKKADLEDSFYTTVDSIKDMITDEYKDKMYDEKSGKYAFLLALAGAVLYAVMWLVSKLTNGSPILTDDEMSVYIALDLVQVLLPIIGCYGIGKMVMRGRKNPIPYVLMLIPIVLGVGAAGIFDSYMGQQKYLYFAGTAMCLVLFVVGGLCEKKTEYYADILGKIRGFKRFLQVAEKSRIDMLAEQDPNYYYRTLAFAFALGVSAVYAKRFASMAKQAPDWYRTPYYAGVSTFNAADMASSLGDAMHGFSNSMTSSPSSKGGGGGFSGGGGAGGGGGGSW